MTMISGVRILVAPCCGARYAHPNYTSLNFMAAEVWTDGWRLHSLVPNDMALRRCACGEFIVLGSTTDTGRVDASELPRLSGVREEQLPECFASSSSKDVEIAARTLYWRSLNHNYRERYRVHRAAEEAATEAAWAAENPDRRTLLDKLRWRKAPRYQRPAGAPLTCPIYEPSQEQLQNMQHLVELLHDRRESDPSAHAVELAEPYREQARFDDATRMLALVETRQASTQTRLVTELTRERQSAPTRYRSD